MANKIHFLILFLVLTMLTGCQTLKGTANGFGQDVQNISNPDKNGWNALQKADDWERQNMW
jgi:predicted small secreted protein